MNQKGSDISFNNQFIQALPIPALKYQYAKNKIIDKKLSTQNNIFLVINNNYFNNENQLLSVFNQSSFLNLYKMIKGNLSLNTNIISLENNQNKCLLANNPDNNSEKTMIVKKPFTNVEDDVLLSLIKTYGPKKWQKISQMMKNLNFNRNGRQCRDRYFHYLDPNINVDQNWSPEEDSLLLNTVDKIGKKWKSMEKMFKGRTEVSLRNRYKLLLRKKEKEKRAMKKKLSNDDQNDNELTFNLELFKEQDELEYDNSLNIESGESLYNLYY